MGFYQKGKTFIYYFNQAMKGITTLVILSFLIMAALSACPRGCVCNSGSSTCASCAPGFYNLTLFSTSPFCAPCNRGCASCQTSVESILSNGVSFWKARIPIVTQYLNSQGVNAAGLGIPAVQTLDSLSESQSSLWGQFYVLFKLIMSQGGEETPENLASSFHILRALSNNNMAQQTKVTQIVERINLISQNPQPLPYIMNMTLIAQEVADEVQCSQCSPRFYNMSLPLGSFCVPCDQYCDQCSFQMDSFSYEVKQFWKEGVTLIAEYLTNQGLVPADEGIPEASSFDSMAEQDTGMWTALYIFFNVIMSDGGSFDGTSLNESLAIMELLSDPDTDKQTKINQIVGTVNRISGNPNPRKPFVNTTMIVVQVDQFQRCTQCGERAYMMEVFRGNSFCAQCPEGCPTCQLSVQSVVDAAEEFWAQKILVANEYVADINANPANFGIPDVSTLSSMSEDDARLWTEFYVIFKIIISQGAQENGENLAASFAIRGYLADDTMNGKTKTEMIISKINEISQNSEPLPLRANNTLLANEVRPFTNCGCNLGQYTAGPNCFNCPRGCRNCSLLGSGPWTEAKQFWVESIALVLSTDPTIEVPLFSNETNSNVEKTIWSQMFFCFLRLQEVDGNRTDKVELILSVLYLYDSLTVANSDTLEIFTQFLSDAAMIPLQQSQVWEIYVQYMAKYVGCTGCASTYRLDSTGVCRACGPSQYNSVADPARTPICKSCPSGCAKCHLDSNNRTVCLECKDNFRFNFTTNSCFECNNRCLSCVGSTNVCTECVPPFLHVEYSYDNQTCVEDQYCGTGCAHCDGSQDFFLDAASGSVTDPSQIADAISCAECMPNKFNLGINCYNCPSGCSGCSLNEDVLWTEVSTFLQLMANTVNIPSTLSTTPTLPRLKDIWIKIYAISVKVGEQANVTAAEMFTRSLPLALSLQTIYKPKAQFEAIASFVRSVLVDSSANSTDVVNGFTGWLHSYTQCTECLEFFELDPADDSCAACLAAGTFNANPDPQGAPNCRPCPQNCLECEMGTDGKPFCFECVSGANLDEERGLCFSCNPKCLGCAGNRDNCIDCQVPFILQTLPDGTGNRCVRNDLCPKKCAACSGMENLPANPTPSQIYTTVLCDQCMDGNYLLGQECKTCPFGTTLCHLDESGLAGIVSQYWSVQLVNIANYLVSLGGDGSGVPTMSSGQTVIDLNLLKWTKIYFIVKYMLELDNGQTQPQEALLMRAEGIYNYLSQNPISLGEMEMVASFLNQQFNLRGSNAIKTDILSRKFNKALEEFVVADDCADGFVLDAANDVCSRCPPTCLDCNPDGTCSVCSPGLWSNAGTCSQCHSRCLTCSGSTSNDCLSCELPYTLSGSSCVKCQNPCKTCDSADTDYCLTCKKPFSATPVSGECFRCQDQRCLSCDASNPSVCLECQSGLILLADGICNSCPKNCLSCSSGSNSTCFECTEGFTAHNGTCIKCPVGCSACESENKSICLSCFDGNFLNADTQTCKKCETGCKICDQNGCSLYEDGSVAYLNQMIVMCDPGCSSCDPANPRKCLACSPKFAFDDVKEVCRPCGQGCTSCTYNGPNAAITCDQCVPGTYGTGPCLPCGQGCNTCTDANTCSECRMGYNLNGGACAKDCETGCVVCDSTDSTICLQVKAGYTLAESGKVVKCARKCSGSCDPEEITSCTSCADGFVMGSNGCQKCSRGTLTCTEFDSLTCQPGFQLTTVAVKGNQVDVCTEVCELPCQKCKNQVCQACIYGYKLTSTKTCEFDESAVCTQGVCQFCPMGLFLAADGLCSQCSAQGCLTCADDECTGCVAGFYLDAAAVCESCASQCRTCFDSATCDLCADGFFKEVVSMTEGASDAVFSDSCVACDSNCKTCFLESYRCQSCPDNFRLSGSNRCIGQFTVNVGMVLDIDFSTFTSSYMSEELIELIATYLGINIEDIDLISLTSGSTDAEISISATSQADATDLAGVDVNSMAASSSGSYFPVLSSSVGVYLNDETYTGEESSSSKGGMALIIGIAVGVVVLSVIVGVVVYKIRQHKNLINSTMQVQNMEASNCIIEPNYKMKVEDYQSGQSRRDEADIGLAKFKVLYN